MKRHAAWGRRRLPCPIPPAGTPLALTPAEGAFALGIGGSMRPGQTDHIGELEQLTNVLTQQRDQMEHGESRRFAETLLQSAMAKVCAEKAQHTVPAPEKRAA
jgi:hypothetical protein